MPLSRDPKKRAAQLANLRRGETVAPLGHTRSLKHGARSTLAMTPNDRDLAEIIDALTATAPVRDPDGGLPAVDEAAVEIAARALKRYRSVSTWCDLHGRVKDNGEEQPAAR